MEDVVWLPDEELAAIQELVRDGVISRGEAEFMKRYFDSQIE